MLGSVLISTSQPQTIVNIKVGGAVFPVHKELFCLQSPFIANAIAPSIHRSGIFAGSIPVVEIDAVPDVFGLCIEWIYAKSITLPTMEHLAVSTVEDAPHDDILEKLGCAHKTMLITRLIHLWLLAEYLCIPHLQNDALELLHEKCNYFIIAWDASYLPLESFKMLYDKTERGSLLRKWLVHFLISTGSHFKLGIDSPSEFPSEMWYDLLCAAQERLKKLGELPTYVLEQIEEYDWKESNDESDNETDWESWREGRDESLLERFYVGMPGDNHQGEYDEPAKKPMGECIQGSDAKALEEPVLTEVKEMPRRSEAPSGMGDIEKALDEIDAKMDVKVQFRKVKEAECEPQ
jgi:hypothetical protein